MNEIESELSYNVLFLLHFVLFNIYICAININYFNCALRGTSAQLGSQCKKIN